MPLDVSMEVTSSIELKDVAYIPEVTLGTTPATPSMTEYRQNEWNVKGSRELLESARRLGDGQRDGDRLGRKSVSGNGVSELCYSSHEPFIEALMGDSFPSDFTELSDTTFACVAASQTITDSGNGLGVISVGDWVTVAGFTEAANNGSFKVSSVAAGVITVGRGALAIVDEAVGDSVTITAQAFAQIAGITFACVNATQTITDSGTGMGDIAVGDWIIVAGFTTAANNGVFYVTAAAAGVITVAKGTTLVDEVAGDSVTIDRELRCENGTIMDSFTFEERYDDIGVYFVDTGVVVDSASLEANNELATIDFSFLGIDEERNVTSLDATPTASADEDPFDYLQGDWTINLTDARFTSISLDIQRRRTGSKPLGSFTADEMRKGGIRVSGTFSIYFQNKVLADAFWAGTHQAIGWTLTDPDGNYYVIHLYDLLITDRTKEEDEDSVVMTYAFNAQRDTVTGKTMGIAKYAA